MMPRVFIWALIVVCGATALARLSESAVRLWPAMRWVMFTVGAIVGQLFVLVLRSWLRKRAARKKADLGLIFDPLKKLHR